MTQTRIGTFLKELAISWKDSLKLFIDKRFWLVTLKATIETYTELFKRFWWLIVLSIFVDVVTRMKIVPSFNEPFYVLWYLLWCFLALIVFLIVRSSLNKKDFSYYFSYWEYYSWVVFVTAALWILRLLSNYTIGIHTIVGLFWQSIDYLMFLKNFPGLSTIYFSPFLVIYTFFYLDSSKKIAYFLMRFWSALCMIFYTYPFCLLVWLLCTVAAFLIEFIIIKCMFMGLGMFYFEKYTSMYHLLQIIADDASKLLIPFFICLFHTLYTKQVHDHYDRYSL